MSGVGAARIPVNPLLVIGDALLDRDLEGHVERECPDAPAPVLDEGGTVSRPGGAALAAALAAAGGREVTLIAALGDDGPGRELAGLLEDAGVELLDLGLAGPTPQKVRVRDRGRTLVRIDRGRADARPGALSAAARAAIGWAETILVSDYGRGLSEQATVRAALVAAARARTVVWDTHPRGPAPVPGVALATPNSDEARAFAGASATYAAGATAAESCGRELAARWRAQHVCVTRGGEGAVVCHRDGSIAITAPFVCEGDSCGAGDRFAATAAGALADGSSTVEAVRIGVGSASGFVAGGGAGGWAARSHAVRQAAPVWTEGLPHAPARSALSLASAVHSHGGTLVATGGCFDLLHAGHISTLQSARALGDALVVCLNSDASVSRLKGPGRPLVGEDDRARVLAALACVDAVALFDQDTPAELLSALRPDVWVKGGDYEAAELPEREVVERWGGRVATLPYLEGHSTSRLLKEVVGRGGS
ncbi:MAG TPA: D-glycero-beta-D-manno-heptose 1-phosphate adenylyltransferase [Solirubrobacteraceae bacterium]|jgi:rfaE bifunctional protein nucleotidyltransferase chain/domain/rfaE bifunctional protein kinase chain/domain